MKHRRRAGRRFLRRANPCCRSLFGFGSNHCARNDQRECLGDRDAVHRRDGAVCDWNRTALYRKPNATILGCDADTKLRTRFDSDPLGSESRLDLGARWALTRVVQLHCRLGEAESRREAENSQCRNETTRPQHAANASTGVLSYSHAKKM